MDKHEVLCKLSNGDDLVLLNTEDVFAPGYPPTVVVGGSRTGKTVIVADIPRALKNRITGLYLLTNSYDSRENSFLRKKIPRMFVHGYSIEKLNSILRDIYERSNNHSRYTQPEKVQDFLQKNLEDPRELKRMLDELDDTLADIRDEYPDDGAFNEARSLLHHNVMVAYIAKNFYVDPREKKYTEEDSLVINYCKSTSPMPLIIADDVSASMANPPSQKYRVTELKDNKLVESIHNGKMAQNLLLYQICSTIRHHGISAFFIHGYSALGEDARKNLKSVVLLGYEALNNALQAKYGGILSEHRELVKEAFRKAKAIDQFYHIVYTADPADTKHGMRIAAYKAKLTNEYIEFGVSNFRLFTRLFQKYCKELQEKKSKEERKKLERYKQKEKIIEEAEKMLNE